MKILYTGLQYNYYNPNQGLSFEHNNFYLGLLNYPGAEVKYFPYDRILEVGKKRWNQELLETVKKNPPDLLFCFMFTDELAIRTLEQIKQLTTSLAWFADDHWRIYNYSRFYAPHFTWSVTTWSRAPAIYGQYKIKNIIRSQWACNTKLWKSLPVRKEIGVSFVGQRTEERASVITQLREAGINVYTRGWGWPEGRASQEDMVRIFSSSKINLNINSTSKSFSLKSLGRLFLKRSGARIVPSFDFINNFRSWRGLSVPQIKARPFELAGCRAFIISGIADDMSRYYRENEEMVFYKNADDLVDKLKYYLEHDKEREQIAQAAYERTLREHTYEKRFEDIFRKISF